MTRLRQALALRGLDLCDVVVSIPPVDAAYRIGPRLASIDLARAHAIADGATPTDGECATLSRRLNFPPRFFTLPPSPTSEAPVFFCGPDVHLGVTCRWCRKPAEYACDYLMPDGETCDRELCANHATPDGDDLHRCPDHRGAAYPDLTDDDEKWPEL
jgi:hypothetical protein